MALFTSTRRTLSPTRRRVARNPRRQSFKPPTQRSKLFSRLKPPPSTRNWSIHWRRFPATVATAFPSHEVAPGASTSPTKFWPGEAQTVSPRRFLATWVAAPPECGVRLRHPRIPTARCPRCSLRWPSGFVGVGGERHTPGAPPPKSPDGTPPAVFPQLAVLVPF